MNMTLQDPSLGSVRFSEKWSRVLQLFPCKARASSSPCRKRNRVSGGRNLRWENKAPFWTGCSQCVSLRLKNCLAMQSWFLSVVTLTINFYQLETGRTRGTGAREAELWNCWERGGRKICEWRERSRSCWRKRARKESWWFWGWIEWQQRPKWGDRISRRYNKVVWIKIIPYNITTERNLRTMGSIDLGCFFAESVFELDHIKHDWYEKNASLMSVPVYVKNASSIKVAFQEKSVNVKFKTKYVVACLLVFACMFEINSPELVWRWWVFPFPLSLRAASYTRCRRASRWASWELCDKVVPDSPQSCRSLSCG